MYRWLIWATGYGLNLNVRLCMRTTLALFIASAMLLCAGCYESRPEVVQANVTYWQDGKPMTRHALGPRQIKRLSAWLSSHRWGWQPVVASYLPDTHISILFADGSRESANVMSSTITLGNSQLSLTTAERHELRSILNAQQ